MQLKSYCALSALNDTQAAPRILGPDWYTQQSCCSTVKATKRYFQIPEVSENILFVRKYFQRSFQSFLSQNESQGLESVCLSNCPVGPND